MGLHAARTSRGAAEPSHSTDAAPWPYYAGLRAGTGYWDSATVRPTLTATDRGFTLIELLVAITIIAILGATAVTFYLRQQVTAQDAQAVSELGLAHHALVLWSTDHDGAFTTSLGDLADYGYTNTEEVTGTAIAIISADDREFCIEATSATGTSFRVASGTGINPGSCA